MIIEAFKIIIDFKANAASIQKLDRQMGQLRNSALLLGLAMSAASIGLIGVLREGAKFQQINIAFETLVGNAEKSKVVMKELLELARITPFSMEGVLQGAKLLLAYSIEADKVVDTLRVLGDITSAVGTQKLPNLVLALGQVKSATKLYLTEVRQFREAGMNILDLIAAQISLNEGHAVSIGEVEKRIHAGAISYDMVWKALKRSTEEGGRFYNMMERISKTFIGTIDIIKDTFRVEIIKIGEAYVNKLQPYLNKAREYVESHREQIQKSLTGVFDVLFNFVTRQAKVFMTFFRVLGIGKLSLDDLSKAMKVFLGLLTALFALRLGGVVVGLGLKLGSLVTGVGGLGFMLRNLKLGALGVALGLIYIAIEDIFLYLDSREDGLKKYDTLTGRIISKYKNTGKAIMDFLFKAGRAFESLGSKIGTFAKTEIFGDFGTQMGEFWDALVDEKTWNRLKQIFKHIKHYITENKDTLLLFLDIALTPLKLMIGFMVTSVELLLSLFSRMLKYGTGFIKLFGGDIKGGIADMVSAIAPLKAITDMGKIVGKGALGAGISLSEGYMSFQQLKDKSAMGFVNPYIPPKAVTAEIPNNILKGLNERQTDVSVSRGPKIYRVEFSTLGASADVDSAVDRGIEKFIGGVSADIQRSGGVVAQ